MDCLVEFGEGKCVTLVVENMCHSPFHLNKGISFGESSAVEIVNWSDVVGEEKTGSRHLRRNQLFAT